MPAEVQSDVIQSRIKKSTNGRLSGKYRLITRENLDKRTLAHKKFDAIATAIANDLGGEERLSTIERHLIESFCGVALCVQDINARVMLGEEFDILALSNAVSTMVRVASRIGIARVPRDVTSLADLIRADAEDRVDGD
jgi:hypothetical protein